MIIFHKLLLTNNINLRILIKGTYLPTNDMTNVKMGKTEI